MGLFYNFRRFHLFQELYKSVTGILNKLTPEKFEHLIERIKNLPIDNVPRLQGVIDLIFDKVNR